MAPVRALGAGRDGDEESGVGGAGQAAEAEADRTALPTSSDPETGYTVPRFVTVPPEVRHRFITVPTKDAGQPDVVLTAVADTIKALRPRSALLFVCGAFQPGLTAAKKSGPPTRKTVAPGSKKRKDGRKKGGKAMREKLAATGGGGAPASGAAGSQPGVATLSAKKTCQRLEVPRICRASPLRRPRTTPRTPHGTVGSRRGRLAAARRIRPHEPGPDQDPRHCRLGRRLARGPVNALQRGARPTMLGHVRGLGPRPPLRERRYGVCGRQTKLGVVLPSHFRSRGPSLGRERRRQCEPGHCSEHLHGGYGA